MLTSMTSGSRSGQNEQQCRCGASTNVSPRPAPPFDDPKGAGARTDPSPPLDRPRHVRPPRQRRRRRIGPRRDRDRRCRGRPRNRARGHDRLAGRSGPLFVGEPARRTDRTEPAAAATRRHHRIRDTISGRAARTRRLVRRSRRVFAPSPPPSFKFSTAFVRLLDLPTSS
jgi:hypothetical protein